MVRCKSWYIPKGWTKEPFDIGYPLLSDQLLQVRKKVVDKLFNTKPITAFEKFKQDHRLEEWDQLTYSDQLEYEISAIQSNPSHFVQKPVDVRGIDLLQLETGIKTKHNLVKKWNSLTRSDQERLTQGPRHSKLFQERLRIWRGYEIVEYLKQNLDHYNYNPWPLLGLYPWEIVKDKLRNKQKLLEFEYDYYDVLIKEAFGRNSTRQASHIFFTDYRTDDSAITRSDLMDKYNKLPPEKVDYYKSKHEKRKQQAILGKSPINLIAFHNFYYKNYHQSVYRPLLHATMDWNGADKTPYKPQNSDFGKTRIYKEQLLDLKTQVVMDYLYYTGGVIGAPPNFNWLANMKSIVGKLHYVNKIYTPKVV